MVVRLVCLGIWIGSLVGGVGWAAVQGSPPDPDSTFAGRILTILDVVMEQHIDPPVRQQMLLSGVKAVYRKEEQLMPRELREEISGLGTRQALMDYLNQFHEGRKQVEGLEETLTRGLLEALPGGGTFREAAAERVDDQIRTNRYVGIGIVLSMNQQAKLPQIPKVFYEGPAWNEGVQAGDLILQIDGEATLAKPLDQILQELRGEQGSKVSILVRQPDADDSRLLTIERDRVFIPTVEGISEKSPGQWQYILDSASDIAYVRFTTIGPSTLHELRKVEARLRGKDIRGIVLDLRMGGGMLHDVTLIADALLEEGTIGHVRSATQVQTYQARPGALFPGIPMAVLVERSIGSDRVFLAAALQDLGRAVVVGEPTFGETYVKSVVPIPGREDKIGIATGVMQRGDGTPLLPARQLRLYIPSVGPLRKEEPKPGNVVPDHVVRSRPNSQSGGQDAVLTRAVKVLKEISLEAGRTSPRNSRSS